MLFSDFYKNGKKSLIQGESGTILMELSKAYDCLPHDLLIAKLEAYGLDNGSLTFFYITSVLEKKELKLVPLIVNGQKLDVELLKGQY